MPKETQLLLLLRKYVRSARLESVELPVPFERVLFLRFHHPEHAATTLVVEPIGQLGNLILVNADDRILDALVRVPAGENAQRVLLPRRIYQLPPPQDRLPPLEESEDPHWEAAQSPADEAGANQAQAPLLWRSLPQPFRRRQPDSGQRSGLAVDRRCQRTAHSASFRGRAPGAQQLVVVSRRGRLDTRHRRGRTGTAASLLHPTSFISCGEFAQTESTSAAVAAFYAAQERDVSSSRDEYAGVRGGVAALVRQALARVQSQLRALAADEPAPGEPERVRTRAGWLLALSSQITQGTNGPGAQGGIQPAGTVTPR